jgi:hypothetical protein
MLPQRKTGKRPALPAAYRAAAYALSILLVVGPHVAAAERAAALLS